METGDVRDCKKCKYFVIVFGTSQRGTCTGRTTSNDPVKQMDHLIELRRENLGL